MADRKLHWEAIYGFKPEEKLSWTQPLPSPSLEWILKAVPNRKARIIDVGGGLSNLVDHLLDEGFERPAVLDISAAALELAKNRLGQRANEAEWIEVDVTSFRPATHFDLWHDRAVFHFLTKPEDRKRYCEALDLSLAPQGKILIATFSPHGPSQCSGLDVMRFDAAALEAELGPAFRLIREERVEHTTPWRTIQEFQYCLFDRVG